MSPDIGEVLARSNPVPISEFFEADEIVCQRIIATRHDADQVAKKALPLRLRRPAAAIGVASALLVTTLGGAFAAGGIPAAIGQIFPWLASPDSDAVSVSRIAEVGGPSGDTLEFWLSLHKDGYSCVNYVRSNSGQEVPARALSGADPDSAGANCQLSDDKTTFGSGGNGGTNTEMIYTLTAGGATRAELRLSGGKTLSATVAKGWIVGWYSISPGETATLVGYRNDGGEVGRVNL